MFPYLPLLADLHQVAKKFLGYEELLTTMYIFCIQLYVLLVNYKYSNY